MNADNWSKGWGEFYSARYRTRHVEVRLYRRGQRCRWYNVLGEQYGPEQKNVAPALLYAFAERWVEL